MKCALWLGGKKVWNAADIDESFDLASLMGYYLGGSLIPWLLSNGGEKYAAALVSVAGIDSETAIMTAFGRNFPIKPTVPEASFPAPQKSIKAAVCSFSAALLGSKNTESTSYFGSFTSAQRGSYGSLSSFGSFSGEADFTAGCVLNKYGYGIHLI